MRGIVFLYVFFIPILLVSQSRTPKDFGFRHIVFNYKGDDVDILVKSKKGEIDIPKPLFFFIQGSLPHPLIITENGGNYGVFPFDTDSIEQKYHLVIVGKPFTPVIVDKNKLKNFQFIDSTTNRFSKEYIKRNHLDYYVDRDIKVLEFLLKRKWVKKNKLVVSTHSEGSTIGSKLCVLYPKVTHLIYSGGNPFGRYINIIRQNRFEELSDSTVNTEDAYNQWKNIVREPQQIDNSDGDTYKGTFGFSIPPINYLRKLKIPVLVSYGTMDYCSPFNDYMRLEFIQKGKSNFTFKPYIGLEHNYFPKDKMGVVNHNEFNWNKVSSDWLKWLDK
jgi:hypothetical protein